MLKLLPVALALAYLWHCSSYVAPTFSTAVLPLLAPQVSHLETLNLTVRNPIQANEQVFHGRFLHITDIHPDEFYVEGSSHDAMCHGGSGTAGKYGDAVLGCDSPVILMNKTFEWIEHNLKDKIDFVIWTGDNIRHDNDRQYPRYEKDIFRMNQRVSNELFDLFSNRDSSDPNDMLVDLIPSLGNNDVYPHNLFSPGPTLQTREMFKIWAPFVPQEQFHIFSRGAYFFKEVVPGQLAVLSINTLYLFQSNPLVDNCDSKKDPGYKLFKWLGVILKEMRSRNMKVWLSGHVPPNEKNYDISCLRKYIIWSYEFRDVIIGGLYGHMNLDHFIPLDAKAAYKSLKKLQKEKKKKKKGKGKGKSIDDEFEIPDFDVTCAVDEQSDEEDNDILSQQPPMRIAGGIPNNKVNYVETLREDYYANIKGVGKSGVEGERYSIAHVTASVIPTFNPGLRVWEYNTTGLKDLLENQPIYSNWNQFFAGVDKYMEYLDSFDDEDEIDDDMAFFGSDYFTFKKDKTLPPKKPADIPLGPAYTPQTFSPLRYTQYYLDLEKVNSGEKPFNYEYEYSTDDSHYGMKHLLVKDWLKLGRRLGEPVKPSKKPKADNPKLEKLWEKFLHRAFVDSGYEDMGYG